MAHPRRLRAVLFTLSTGSVLCACTAKHDGSKASASNDPRDASARVADDAGARLASPPIPSATATPPSEAGIDNGPSSVDTASDTAGPTSAQLTTEPTTTRDAPADALAIPARIEAEAFVRFNETDAPMDDNECGDGRVDMGLTDDADGECYVGWTQGGEWLEYDVWSSTANVYSLTLRLASGDAGREVSVLVDGAEIGSVAAPGQGWTDYRDVVLEGVVIGAGVHTVRIAFTSGQTNVNYLVFDAPDDATPTASGSATSETSASSTDGNAPDPAGAPSVNDGCAVASAGYELVWSDEFNYQGLPDPARWGYEVGGDGWGNGELQYYTDGRQDNALVSDGLLTITAVPEQYEGNEYTSAKLNSAYGASNPGSWNEGIIAIRARLPSGLGTWPALWMMPNNCTEGWPACGEIDIMEHVGYDEGTVHGTIHTDAFNHVEGTQRGQSVVLDDVATAFHEYTFIWQEERLQWLVDGEVYFTIDKAEDWGFAEWPFSEKSWHLKVNLAVGGEWGGAEGVNRDDFPTQFEIDQVCVYQQAP